MKIEYRIGDLLTTDCFYLVQGCNSLGQMGSGIAKLLREVYPEGYAAYREVYDRRGLVMGETIATTVHPVNYLGVDYQERCLINAITQEFAGRVESIVYVSYDAIAASMVTINNWFNPEWHALQPAFAKTDGVVNVAMPLIGAGLANGDWKIIAELIETVSTNFKPIVYVQTQAEMDRVYNLLK